MDTISSLGWLLPAWIIGAPLLAAVVMLMTTPKGSHRSTYSDPHDRTGLPGTAGGRDSQVLSGNSPLRGATTGPDRAVPLR